ncbi:predicted protein [Plenodomus lingam JN3]|uniref:Predicted protein n=1 Tax=Leptosphaeria maculans (strain JN3 / isolate v23.1.3 / race Av1-4-5-6-7-8) TaxID=985895 RepID=E4ZYR3_LEPMJ|nr:predicted protein [Plenodomus lingam JN3]CBX96589.1 predicted protein [Plenodomus lingam JN3]
MAGYVAQEDDRGQYGLRGQMCGWLQANKQAIAHGMAFSWERRQCEAKQRC